MSFYFPLFNSNKQTNLHSSSSLSSMASSSSTEYELLECIGHGTFGRVHLAIHTPTSSTVAIKIIPITSGSASSLSTLRSEVESLKAACSHINVVKYHTSLIVGEEVWIVMEYCELGSLRDFIEDKSGRRVEGGKGLEEGMVWYVGGCVLEALAFLHHHNIIHRDLKAANILVTKEHVIKLADFGVAITEDKKRVEVAGSPYWMAPEVIKEHKSSFASDIWSFGITMIELFTGNPPYAELSPASAIRKIASDVPPVLNCGSQELRRVIEGCLHDDPLQRPTAIELLARMRRADDKAFHALCASSTPSTRSRMKDEACMEVDRRTLMSEWTFGATISSDFTLKTWLEDMAGTSMMDTDAKVWQRRRVGREEAGGQMMMSPSLPSPSTAALSRMGTIKSDGVEGVMEGKLLRSLIESKTMYSEEERDALKRLVKAKKAACPHICPRLDAASHFTELMRGSTLQTEEQRDESNKIGHLILEHGPIKAALEYALGKDSTST